MGEAIPLQEVRVLGVCSEKSHGQWEMIDKGQSMTRKSHGGIFLRIATVDIGYGHDGIAKMNSSQLKKYNMETKSDTGIIYAFIKYWNADGFDGGNFTYENYSMTGNFNNISTRLYIQS